MPVTGHQGGLVEGGDSSQKCQIGDVSLPPKELHVSRPPNERPWGLWGFSHSSHKNQRRRGPRYLRLGDTPAHPPLSGSMTSVSSGYSSRAGQSHTSSRVQGPHSSSQSHPSLDTRAEICTFPLDGKWSGRPGWSVLPQVLCLPLSQGLLHLSLPTPGPSDETSPLWICLAPTYHCAQPIWGLTHGGSSSASLRSWSPTLATGVCSS